MKFSLCSLFIFIALWSVGQQNNMSKEWENHLFNDPNLNKENVKEDLKHYDFSSLWTQTDNQFVYGFIGSNFERIRIKFISIEKDSLNEDTCWVVGKSMVRNTVCDFNGTIVLERIHASKTITEEYKSRGAKSQGFLTASYTFKEDSTQKDAGMFGGSLTSLWYIDQNDEVRYDDVIIGADAFRNNQFTGTWTSYSSGNELICNWGDYRILNCGKLDIGAGMFSPDDPYLKFGWQGYRDAIFNSDKEAYADETRKWWNE